MADRRRAEIEEKKAKLAELRRARDERRAQLAQAEQRGVPAEPLTSHRRDVNELVDSLVGPSASSTRPTSPFVPASSSSRIPPSSASGFGGGRATPSGSVPGTPGGRTSRLSDGPAAVTGNSRGVGGGDRDSAGSFQAVDYVDHSAELYELPSKVIKPVTYSKAVQTTSISISTSDMEDDSDDERDRNKATDGASGRETEEEMRKRILAELEEERKVLERELQEMKEKEVKISELSNEERQAIFAAPDFSAFIEESTKIVQRALSDGYDYIKDYTIGIDGAFDESEGQRIKLVCAFQDDRWTNGRSVTDLDWSPKFQELCVAAYNKNPSAPNDPDGIVAVWNLHLLERPEFIFHSPSDVLSVTFSPYHPTLIFGGSYSGQVLLWDTRAKHLPVLKTPLSASGHTYPIYAMKMIGTQNANNLISSSTDGLVCSWLADMLAQPQEALPLTVPSHNKTDEVSITSLDFPHSDTSTFYIGTEEGSIYSANRFDRASAKAGLNGSPENMYKGHAGPVTGLHFHPGTGGIDFSDLFLSSSVDWTVKLWRGGKDDKKGGLVSSSGGKDKEGIAPIKSFESSEDYVFDVQWHPGHPAIFGCVDGTGKLDLWNLNQDVEVPIISTQVSPRALNKLSFDKTTQGRKVATGGADGKVYVYDMSEKLVSPRENEWVEMQKTVQGLVGGNGGFGLGGAVDLATTSERRR
ncbi:WD40-repeat-containing domain protein [Naematelia encephala]|uniref:WD40-repeat-containing domain protein n=1 Tax=Naematelia encephala TaxID=71784 RepID=A0A1Y2BB30_9TREE|nr:WD40-repeat-containing domain protein [Naematelia encephala]